MLSTELTTATGKKMEGIRIGASSMSNPPLNPERLYVAQDVRMVRSLYSDLRQFSSGVRIVTN
jgi:hypothetical protein